jgi:hypothetical protein
MACIFVVFLWGIRGGMHGKRGQKTPLNSPLKTRQYFEIYFWLDQSRSRLCPLETATRAVRGCVVREASYTNRFHE